MLSSSIVHTKVHSGNRLLSSYQWQNISYKIRIAIGHTKVDNGNRAYKHCQLQGSTQNLSIEIMRKML